MTKRTIALICAALIIMAAGYGIGSAIVARAEEKTITAWAFCKPGSQINVRQTPSKTGKVTGYLEIGDEFQTDGTSKNGFIRVYGVGEAAEAWVYAGYVVTEKPELIAERYRVSARTRVACRKWVNGPLIDGRCWMTNGANLTVYAIADDWAITSRGYVQTEWLEADPV